MTKVLVDDSSLNNIANSIRRKNGLVRTYKPREMAPAIRSFQYYIPTSHEYTVTINQSEHQRIIVRKYLDADLKEYDSSFTVSEPFCKLDLSIEADAGWNPGTLNYQSPVTVDRDMVISATHATEQDSELTRTLYCNGTKIRFSAWSYWSFYSDFACTQDVERQSVYGKVNIVYNKPSDKIVWDGNSFAGWDSNAANALMFATEINANSVDASDFTVISYGFYNCAKARNIYVESWNTHNCSSFYKCFSQCSQLRKINISNWDTSNLLTAERMFESDEYLQSLDLSKWETPLLLTCGAMFIGCSWLRVIDISNWSTSQIETVFGLPTYLNYLIMDKEEIKFPNKIFSNNTRTKYLVPSNMVDLYKEHANWSERASQIDSIDNYTITRSDGEVWVEPNPY